MYKYWENETPVEVYTGKNRLKYFRNAGKLQISACDWQNADGETKQGKTVSLDVEALCECTEALAILRDVLTECGA
ncbi:MAG: hypothetical protein WCP79_14520 [Bacillota bacterium]